MDIVIRARYRMKLIGLTPGAVVALACWDAASAQMIFHGPGIWPKSDGVADVCYVIRPNIPLSWNADIDYGAQLWDLASTKLTLTKHATANPQCRFNYVQKARIDGRGALLGFVERRLKTETILDCDGHLLQRVERSHTILDTAEAWFVGGAPPPNCELNSRLISVRQVGAHEFGHWLVVKHPKLVQPADMMWPFTYSCQVKNALSANDVAEVHNLYCQ